MVAMVTGMCRSVRKIAYFINFNIKLIFCKTRRLHLKNVKLTGTFIVKKATKMQNCGIRNGGRGHELAFKLSMVGIKVLNHH